MKSSIKIDFRSKDNGLEPIIAIKLEDSDDVRDNLLKTFFQSLGGISSWLVVSFDHHMTNPETGSRTWITITPVMPGELHETKKIIEERLISEKGSLNNYNPFQKSEGHSLI